jgi:hypothetical protein
MQRLHSRAVGSFGAGGQNPSTIEIVGAKQLNGVLKDYFRNT